ncbi:hypothetical protein MNBD_CHLOROFLEXI01-4719 [hydrothermal vent metagenome]|uniref:Uncharacterized protein n=1 Tax=hydrothermal vent metagenome TaxID=652676 RepID=A0A3B0UTC6_9ZZZZ
MISRQKQTLFLLGFTAVFIGYLMVWLPGPSAGLRFLGFEMGEWSKFLGVGVKRNWFYLPPLTLALMMLFFTVGWENGRYQTWLFRGVAVVVSWLAFPALEDLLGPTKSDYFSRVAGVGLVLLVALAVSWWVRQPRFGYWGMALVALVGLLWPSLIFWEVRPFASQIMQVQLGIGPGFWLNLLGHAAVLILAVSYLTKKEHTKH